MSHTCKNYPSIDKTLNPGTDKWPGSSMDSSTACYAVQLSSSINGSSINRCAENTDGRHFLHLNSPSVNINRVHLHTVHTFDDKGLKTLTRHSPLHPMINVKEKHWLVKFQTVVHSIHWLLRPFRAHLWQSASQIFPFRQMPRVCWPHTLLQTGNQPISSNYVVVSKIWTCMILLVHMNSRGADVLVDGGCHHQEITRQVYPSCLRLRQLLHLHQHFDLSVDKFLGMIHFRYVFRPHISYTYFSSVNDVSIWNSQESNLTSLFP